MAINISPLWGGPLLSAGIVLAALLTRPTPPACHSESQTTAAAAAATSATLSSPFAGMTDGLCGSDGACWQQTSRGVELVAAPAGSAAEAYGLKAGDLITRIGTDRRVKLHELAEAAETREPLSLHLRRGDQRIEMTIRTARAHRRR